MVKRGLKENLGLLFCKYVRRIYILDRESLKHRVNKRYNEILRDSNGREKPVVRQDKLVKNRESTKDKLKKSILSEYIRDIDDVKGYFIFEVLIPKMKEAFWNMIEDTFIDSTRRGSSGSSYNDYSASYRSSYKGRKSYSRRDRDDRDDGYSSAKISYKKIELHNRNDAVEVVNRLRARIEEYDQASIGDLYDLVGITPEYTDYNWGWCDPNDIGIRATRYGYLIDVAEAQFLD